MKKLLVLAIATFFALGSSSAVAIGPQLQLDCGKWSYIKDGTSAYRELSAMSYYTFAGDSFKYKVVFYGSSKEKFSRGIFQGTYKIENPEYSSREIEFPINMKFGNNKYESFMYKTKYIKGEFRFTDSQFLETLSVKLQKLVAVEGETIPIVKFTRSAYTDKKPQLIGASYA